jgi:ribonuclease T2
VVAVLAALLYRCTQPGGQPSAPPAAKPAPTAQSTRSPPRQAGSFDFYLLDVTHEAAWCEDGNERRGQCRQLDRSLANKRPLVLHGLWPENVRPGAYPSECGSAAPVLSGDLRQRLDRVMPGTMEHLNEHEWRKHGSCTGLDAETYFSEAIRWTERLAKALNGPVRAAAGDRTSAATLRAGIAVSDPALADSVVFMCKNLASVNPQHRRRPYLVSVRVCIDNDGADGRPETLLRCESVGRRDQGCGQSFFVDDIEE